MRTTQSTRAPILLQEGTATAPDEAVTLTGRGGTPRSRQGLQSLRRNDVGKLLLPKDLSAPLGEQHSLSSFLFCFCMFSTAGHGRAKGVAPPFTRPRPAALAVHAAGEEKPSQTHQKDGGRQRRNVACNSTSRGRVRGSDERAP